MSGTPSGDRTDPRHRIGPFELDLQDGCLRRDGEPVKLGTRALGVLAALAERRGRTVSKADLLDAVWPGAVVEENNLQVQVSALRKLLGPAAIATIPGRGYRLVGESQPGDAAPSTVDAEAAEARAGNLPSVPPLLIGREEALARLLERVRGTPLVTIVGAGGIGKTSLALAAGHALAARWADGAWLVELAPVADAGALPQIVAQVLRLPLVETESPQEALARALAPLRALLIIDNCEHLVDAVAGLCESLAQRAPGVHLLATSQERLNVSHEHLFPLEPLALPAADDEAATVTGPPAAVALFVERARAADPRFELGPDNVEAVAEICRRLDGVPLAIELAAARVRHLGVTGLRDALDDRFHVLTGGHRAALPRHRTLRATLEWSHALLTDGERDLLHRLAVFNGGFTLEMAHALGAGEAEHDDDGDDARWAVLDALGHLVDKSLVAADACDPPRYRLLETTRAFALERLEEAGQHEAVAARHARVVLRLFNEADEARFGDGGRLDSGGYMSRLLPELGNLRSAMVWAIGPGGDSALAADLAGASVEVLRKSGLSQQGLTWMLSLRERLPASLDDVGRARFWHRLAMLGINGRLPTAEAAETAHRAAEIYRRRGPACRLHAALVAQAWSLHEGGDAATAFEMLPEIEALEAPDWPARYACNRLNLEASCLRHLGRDEQALATWRRMLALGESEPGEALLRQIAQTNLCFGLNHMRRFDEAVELAAQCLQRAGHGPHDHISYLLTHLLVAQVRLGRIEQARETMRLAVPRWRRDSSLPSKCCELALLFAKTGRLHDAARLDGAAEAFTRSSGYRANPLAEEARQRTQALFEEAGLDAGAVDRARREGAGLDLDAIVALCLAESDASGP